MIAKTTLSAKIDGSFLRVLALCFKTKTILNYNKEIIIRIRKYNQEGTNRVPYREGDILQMMSYSNSKVTYLKKRSLNRQREVRKIKAWPIWIKVRCFLLDLNP